MNISDFLDKKIKVEFCGILDTEEYNEWLDYRVGCSICGNGEAFSIKTNIIELYKKKVFYLNNIEVIHQKYYKNVEPKVGFILNNPKIFHKLKKYYNKLNSTTGVYWYKKKPKSYEINHTGISSVFDEEVNFPLDENDDIYCCFICMGWLKIIDKNIAKYFKKIHPFHIFWMQEIYFQLYYNLLKPCSKEDKKNLNYFIYKKRKGVYTLKDIIIDFTKENNIIIPEIYPKALLNHSTFYL